MVLKNGSDFIAPVFYRPNRKVENMKNDSSVEAGPLPFKTCTVCKRIWGTRVEFLDDPDTSFVGYQVHFKDLTEGLFLFNHSCGATMTLRAGLFKDLYDGPIFGDRLTGTDHCPGYCLLERELRPCPARCECAFVREILQHIKDWPKKERH
jgi:hypothetical protein